MNPRVAVVVPAYNPGTLLRRALDTVRKQTYPDWHAVVVDDGSSEDLSWVASFDPRVTLITQPNRGVSIARNNGVDATHGELIAFLDQDDEWLPTKLARQITAMDTDRTAPFSYTEFTWVLPHGDVPGRYDNEVTYHGLLGGQHVLLSSVVVRRDDYRAVGGHDPAFAMVQDYDLFLRLTMDRGTPICVHEPLVRYHLHGENASRDYRLTHRETTAVLRDHSHRAKQRRDHAAVAAARRGRRTIRHLYAEQALQAFRTSRAPGDLARAVLWNPVDTASGFVRAARHRLRRPR